MSVVCFYRTVADNYNSSLDASDDNIQLNAYSMYKLLNNSNDQNSLNTFNETFHSGTNKLYSYNTGLPSYNTGISPCAKYTLNIGIGQLWKTEVEWSCDEHNI